MKQMAAGQRIDMKRLIARLSLAGYTRTGTVMEPGEYAVRGGILDLFPPGTAKPRAARLLRRHAREHQVVRCRNAADDEGRAEDFADADSRSRAWRRGDGAVPQAAMSSCSAARAAMIRFTRRFSGQRYPGQEHWLPLFHEELETLFDYAEDASVSFDHNADEAVRQRFEQIAEHYDARVEALEVETFGAPPYKPVPPEQMFLDGAELEHVACLA